MGRPVLRRLHLRLFTVGTCRGHIRRDLMQQVLRAQRRRVNKFAPPDAHVRSPEFNLVLGPSLFLESVNHVNVYELRTKNEEQKATPSVSTAPLAPRSVRVAFRQTRRATSGVRTPRR